MPEVILEAPDGSRERRFIDDPDRDNVWRVGFGYPWWYRSREQDNGAWIYRPTAPPIQADPEFWIELRQPQQEDSFAIGVYVSDESKLRAEIKRLREASNAFLREIPSLGFLRDALTEYMAGCSAEKVEEVVAPYAAAIANFELALAASKPADPPANREQVRREDEPLEREAAMLRLSCESLSGTLAIYRRQNNRLEGRLERVRRETLLECQKAIEHGMVAEWCGSQLADAVRCLTDSGENKAGFNVAKQS